MIEKRGRIGCHAHGWAWTTGNWICRAGGLTPPDVRAMDLAETLTNQPRRRTAGVNPAARGTRLSRSYLVATVLLLALATDPTVLGAGTTSASTPQNATELKELEARVRNVVAKVLPAIVAVDGPAPKTGVERPHPPNSHFEGFGSGVIIQSDGLILSQWHVSHQSGLAAWRDPGDPAFVVLQDGRRLRAQVLGADPVRDLSLLRIVEPGKYPSAPLAVKTNVALGDWVLKLGHPFGYRKNRGAVARLGRVLYVGDTIDIVADCRIFAGDSGGPVVNLNGQVVGIIESSAAPQVLRIGSVTLRSDWPFCYSGVATIRARMPAMLHPALQKATSGVYKPDLADFQALGRRRGEEIFGDGAVRVLPEALQSQGETTLAAWNGLCDRFSRCVVEVLAGKQRVALGTIVGSGGWILTKVSEIPEYPSCRLPDGKIVPARVTGVDAAFDLAMLKIEATGLLPVDWEKVSPQPAGTFVAATSREGRPFAAGIISVAKRPLEGPFPTVVTRAPLHVPATSPLAVIGKPFENRGFRIKYASRAAADSGLRSGDVLVSINGRSVRESSDLDKAIQGHVPGENLAVLFERDGHRETCTLTLVAQRYVDCPGAGSRYRNLRADDFPVVFENDLPLTLDECGGPVIGLGGKALGINIARVGEHGSMAIPADAILPRIAQLKGPDANLSF
jgi:S1-C subfamily serine protease